MRRSLVLAIAVLAIGAVGCGKKRQGPVSGSSPDTVVTSSDNDDDYTLGVRVDPAKDPFLRAMAPRLREWVLRWRTVSPGFALDSLYRESSHFPLGYRRAATSEDLERARFFGALSPDSTRIVEPDIYSEKVDGVWELHGEPDCAPAILDLRSDTLTIITVVGTAAAFEDAFWIDRDHILLVANGERRYEPWTGGGDLCVIDLPHETLTYYHTPDVTKDAYEHYLKLSRAAEAKRFGLKPPT